MKKLIILCLCIIFSIIFISCSNKSNIQDNKIENSETQNQLENLDEYSTNQDISDDKKITRLNGASNIENVILSIAGQENEFPLDEDIKEFLNDIKTCNDIPETTLLNKIGSINIKYENGDEEAEYASLYIATDNNVYAKYTTESQNDYAYKIDIDKLSESMGN